MPSTPTAPSTTASVKRVAVIALLALVITAGVGHTLGDLLTDGEASVNPGLLLLSGVLWSLGIAAQGPRWALLLPSARIGGPPPSASRAALAVLGTNALTVTLPGPAGEALLAAFCERDLGIPWATGAAAKLLSRVLGLLILGVLLLLGVGFLPGLLRWAPAGIIAAVAGGVALVIYLGAVGRIRWVVDAMLSLLPAGIQAKAQGPVREILEHALAPRAQPVSMWLKAAAWSLVSTGLMGAGGYVSALAVGVAPDFTTYLWMHVVSSVAGLVGMVVPAGLGPLDALWVLLFVGIDRPVEDGLLAAIAWRQMQAVSLLVSLGPLVWVGRRTATPVS